MMQENKELLLKDLCVRLPYGVICNTPEGDGHLCSIIQTIFGTEYGINIKATERDYFNDKEVCIKPYLRPMSSMTDEEIEQYKCMNDALDENYEVHIDNAYPAFDWLNKYHFDYRGLISKGLAIEVTKENNPYKD